MFYFLIHAELCLEEICLICTHPGSCYPFPDFLREVAVTTLTLCFWLSSYHLL